MTGFDNPTMLYVGVVLIVLICLAGIGLLWTVLLLISLYRDKHNGAH